MERRKDAHDMENSNHSVTNKVLTEIITGLKQRILYKCAYTTCKY